MGGTSEGLGFYSCQRQDIFPISPSGYLGGPPSHQHSGYGGLLWEGGGQGMNVTATLIKCSG